MIVLTYLGIALSGLSAGLLVNYLADVLPTHRQLAKPLWWPLSGLSQIAQYLLPARVLFVQLIFLVLAFFFYRNDLESWSLWQLLIILLYFAVVIVIDIEHRLILHSVSLSGAILLGGIGILRHGWQSTLIGGVAGFAILLALYWLGGVFSNWIAKRRGQPLEEIVLGFGDVNLAGVIGLLLGWPAVIGALILGIFLGGLFSLGYILAALARGRYQAFAAIPYGPFLSLGAILLIALRAYF
jgi:leader peptidase (prepilin peptidase)/N-methyltransferase